MGDCTRVYYDGRLMLTITSGSRFKTMPKQKYDTVKDREQAAKIQIDGWIKNAGYDPQKFKIVHGKSDPMILSKMASDIIRKSRENIGV